MIHNNQHDYDNSTEPDLIDYRDEPMIAQFIEYVTLELLAGRDWQNLSSEILMNDLELLEGGYQKALVWVSERVTEKQYLDYKVEQSVEETT